MVADRLAVVGLSERDWYFAFQSQGVSGGPWIGPTVEETLKALREEGHVGVVMQPVGFFCDHVEILYDIDIAFREIAEEMGMKLWRAESLNDSPVLTRTLVEVVRRTGTSAWTRLQQRGRSDGRVRGARLKRVAIVGGGMAGLAAAYELSRLAGGVEQLQVVCRASGRLGGIVETVREGGFVIEGGPDAWVTEKPWARELAVELGLEEELIYSNDEVRRTYVVIDGRLEAIPDGMRMMIPGDLAALDASELCSAEAKAAFNGELACGGVAAFFTGG